MLGAILTVGRSTALGLELISKVLTFDVGGLSWEGINNVQCEELLCFYTKVQVAE